MAFDLQYATGNRLLDATLIDDLRALAPHLEWTAHALRDRINVPGQPMEYVYFPVSGVFSVVAMYDRDDQVEAGTVGSEGFLGMFTLLQAETSPNLLICQGTGRSLRIPAPRFLAAAAALPEFLKLLLRYVHVYMVQMSSTILANSSYLVEERLARWILMMQDRVGSPRFEMTHEFMSLMLSVRRPSVTDAIHSLEGRHLIRAARGQVQVTDREGLEQLAGGCYGQAEREYTRLIQPAVR